VVRRLKAKFCAVAVMEKFSGIAVFLALKDML
jgi:hypothetical protein